jgi:HD superfamily phosphohydrolase
MHRLNETFDGALDLAIKIFKNEYHKTFLHQLVSGQLDMDRMDYLIRDSYYTGVAEGVIGYDRIIKMLNVYEGELVVEEKGIYSIEKFLLSRKLMYWQVYLHKTALSAEKMLVRLFQYFKKSHRSSPIQPTRAFEYFLEFQWSEEGPKDISEAMLRNHAQLDDTDVDVWIKSMIDSTNPVLSVLSKGLTYRNLFRVYLQKEPFSDADVQKIIRDLKSQSSPSVAAIISQLIIQGSETNRLYNEQSPEIKILMKGGKIQPLSLETDAKLDTQLLKRYYLCHPKLIN